MIVKAAASELPQIALDDALQVCWVFRTNPDLYERAVVRWLGRFCLEVKGVTLDEVQLAATCFEDLHLFPDQALERLQALCAEHNLLRRSPPAPRG